MTLNPVPLFLEVVALSSNDSYAQVPANGSVTVAAARERLLLPTLYGVKPNDRRTGASIPLELPRREGNKQ